jgi:hypothetical protein
VDNLYDTDIYAWSQRQVAVLRDLAPRPDLPNELDLQHVAEEIEDVGISELNAVKSFLRLCFVHLIKAGSVDDAELRKGWFAEIIGFHSEILTRFSNAMRKEIDVDVLWTRAMRQAELSLGSYRQHRAIPPKSSCPLTLDDFLSETFDLDRIFVRAAALKPDES